MEHSRYAKVPHKRCGGGGTPNQPGLAGTDELDGKSGNLIRAAATRSQQPAASGNQQTDSQLPGSGGRSTSASDTLGTLRVDPVPFLFPFPLFSEDLGTPNYRFYICT